MLQLRRLPIVIDLFKADVWDIKLWETESSGLPDSRIALVKYGQLALNIKWYPTDWDPADWPPFNLKHYLFMN